MFSNFMIKELKLNGPLKCNHVNWVSAECRSEKHSVAQGSVFAGH